MVTKSVYKGSADAALIAAIRKYSTSANSPANYDASSTNLSLTSKVTHTIASNKTLENATAIVDQELVKDITKEELITIDPTIFVSQLPGLIIS